MQRVNAKTVKSDVQFWFAIWGLMLFLPTGRKLKKCSKCKVRIYGEHKLYVSSKYILTSLIILWEFFITHCASSLVIRLNTPLIMLLKTVYVYALYVMNVSKSYQMYLNKSWVHEKTPAELLKLKWFCLSFVILTLFLSHMWGTNKESDLNFMKYTCFFFIISKVVRCIWYILDFILFLQYFISTIFYFLCGGTIAPHVIIVNCK